MPPMATRRVSEVQLRDEGRNHGNGVGIRVDAAQKGRRGRAGETFLPTDGDKGEE